MGQFGFFDADRRLAAITAKGDPLEMIARVVPFESFRAEIEAAVLRPASEKKSPAGRKPIDAMVMFRMLVLQSLYNLCDEQVEYQVRDVCPVKASVFSRRQTCRGKSQAPRSSDSRVAGKPRLWSLSTRSLFGEITSHRAVMKINAEVASKVIGSEGRARIRRAKAAWVTEI